MKVGHRNEGARARFRGALERGQADPLPLECAPGGTGNGWVISPASIGTMPRRRLIWPAILVFVALAAAVSVSLALVLRARVDAAFGVLGQPARYSTQPLADSFELINQASDVSLVALALVALLVVLVVITGVTVAVRRARNRRDRGRPTPGAAAA